jgi:hypothetical protein
MTMRRIVLVILATLVAAAAVRGRAADGEAAIEFHRVHVPAGKIAEVPLGGVRHVPMPVAEFEAAVARAAGPAGIAVVAPRPLATAARYAARIDERGWLVGTVTCEVDAAFAALSRVLPLGGLPAKAAGRAAADGRREAFVFGSGDGRLALEASAPGDYHLDFALPPLAASGGHRLPLVPALENVIALELPGDTRPILSGPAVRDAVVTPPDSEHTAWRIAFGPAEFLELSIAPREQPPLPVAVWSRVRFRGGSAELAAACVPVGTWRGGFELLKTLPGLRVTGIRAADDGRALAWQASADGRRLTIMVPAWLDGRRTPLVVHGAMPASSATWRLPLVSSEPGAWAGGGLVVETGPAWALAGIDVTESRVVTPETAAGWPVPALAADTGRPEAVLHVEQQGPAAAVSVTIEPHAPTIDVARVTTVDISPGAVLGRAACDVRVLHGEVFEITARVAPGWIIDAVRLVETVTADAAGAPGARFGMVETAPDWRVVRAAGGDVLRVGLAAAASPSRGVGLRVAGHRGGLPPGSAFGIADIDMVRFAGEAAGAAFIDFKLGSDAFVELGGMPAGAVPLEGRLAALVEEGTPRGRIHAGELAPNRVARLVRRRPPLAARVRVVVEPRADALGETHVFECRAEAGGVEAFLVDFSAPLGDGPEWSLVEPGNATLVARRIEAGEAPSRPAGVAESWLVELSPTIEGPVTVRASRVVPFTGPVVVPLAWVDGATDPGGTVALGGVAGGRLRLRAQGLGELATDVRAEGASSRGAEFAYGPPQPGLAVELEPGAGRDGARAWAWRETITCWCEEAGTGEVETRFALENLGRESVSLTVPGGCRLLEVLVDGATVIDGEAAASGATVRVPLPPDRRRVDLIARVVATHGAIVGWRRIEPSGCSIDAPVLERELRLLLPPRLHVAATVAAWRCIDEPAESWTARLWGSAPRPTPAGDGFRVRRFVVADRDAGGIVVVHERLLAAASILAVAAMLAGIRVCGFRNPAAVAWLASAAGIITLWAAAPFDFVARAAWWAAVAGLCASLVVRWWSKPWRPARAWAAAARAGGLVLSLCAAPAMAADGGWRVFITPGEGAATALVPEPLFRRLAEAAAPATAAIRVTECRVVVPEDGDSVWRVELGIDADAGGTLVLDQGATGATWGSAPRSPAAGAVFVQDAHDGRPRLRLTAAVAGRHRVALDVRPGTARRGEVDVATIRVPAAPLAELSVAGLVDPGAIGCARAVGDGPFLPVVPAAAGGARLACDISGASQVRLVRPIDRRARLASSPRRALTVNAVEWGLDAARTEATFELDPGTDILTGFTVRADERLADLAVVGPDVTRPQLIPLGGGATRIELTDPTRGPVQLRLAGVVAHASPVGVFDVPAVWLDGVPAEQRSVRVTSAAELDVAIEPPPPPVATAAEFASRPPPRIVAIRRRQRPRGVQALTAVFAPDRIGLELRAQVDSGPLGLTQIPVAVPAGCVVDRVVLVEDDLATAPGRPPAVVDTVWERPAPERLVAVVQRPRAGRFRLAIDARVAARPGDRGRLPLVRAELAGGAPLVVGWRAEPDVRAEIRPAEGGDAAAATVELRDGDAAPEYEILPSSAAAPAARPARVASAPLAAGPSRIERAETFLALDARGRVRGAVRFDLAAADVDVRLRLPAGMRLFDVIVDGVETVAEPVGDGAWGVRLHDVRWPRSILAMFAGELGPDAVDGAPLSIAAPAIEGLPQPAMLWTIRPPAGCDVAVAAPARPLDASRLAEFRESQEAAIDSGFAPALAAAEGEARERLAALAAARRAGSAPPLESAWERGLGWQRELRSEDGADTVAAVASGSLTVRIARRPDPTSSGRARATAVLAAVGAVAWFVASRRRPEAAR